MTVRWVPGHRWATGNGVADTFAKKAAKERTPDNEIPKAMERISALIARFSRTIGNGWTPTNAVGVSGVGRTKGISFKNANDGEKRSTLCGKWYEKCRGREGREMIRRGRGVPSMAEKASATMSGKPTPD